MCVNIKLNQGSWELQALATQVPVFPSMAAGEKGSKLVTVFDGQNGIFCDFLFYFDESSFCPVSILSGLLPPWLKLSGWTAWICFHEPTESGHESFLK